MLYIYTCVCVRRIGVIAYRCYSVYALWPNSKTRVFRVARVASLILKGNLAFRTGSSPGNTGIIVDFKGKIRVAA